MKKKLIVANWKMNSNFDEADDWTSKFVELRNKNYTAMQNVEAVVCPPSFLINNMDMQLLDNSFAEIEEFSKEAKTTIEEIPEEELTEIMAESIPFYIGAQDCHFENAGAFTGDLSAKMLSDMGARFAIVGHSERRKYHLENNEIVGKKAKSAFENDLTPIICVGENQETRSLRGHLEFIYKQLILSVPKGVKFNRLIIAYEPIWSIGTGVVPSAEEIHEMAELIRRVTESKIAESANEFVILYGGSVDEKNAAQILNIDNIDGLLVGGASLDVEKFMKICLS